MEKWKRARPLICVLFKSELTVSDYTSKVKGSPRWILTSFSPRQEMQTAITRLKHLALQEGCRFDWLSVLEAPFFTATGSSTFTWRFKFSPGTGFKLLLRMMQQQNRLQLLQRLQETEIGEVKGLRSQGAPHRTCDHRRRWGFLGARQGFKSRTIAIQRRLFQPRIISVHCCSLVYD